MFVFSSHTRPANSETSPAALTTPALDRRSLRWFGISACTATPEDLPPSLAQHGSCRRSSTSSSSLPFRTHVGARNSAVVVDLSRCGPMLSPRAPNLVPTPGPRMERETPGQRPRPNYGHPQVHFQANLRGFLRHRSPPQSTNHPRQGPAGADSTSTDRTILAALDAQTRLTAQANRPHQRCAIAARQRVSRRLRCARRTPSRRSSNKAPRTGPPPTTATDCPSCNKPERASL